MYCSGCGTQLQSDLNYCNRCGRRVAEDSDRASVAKNLSASLGYIPGVGFFCYIFVVIALVKNGVPGNQIIPITFFYFAALFAICFLILRQTSILSKGERRPADKSLPEEGASNYSTPITTARLRELREPGIGSVIENTTRTLDKVRVERANDS